MLDAAYKMGYAYYLMPPNGFYYHVDPVKVRQVIRPNGPRKGRNLRAAVPDYKSVGAAADVRYFLLFPCP